MEQGNGPVSVCVINLKGGVGKSTVAALLGHHASRRGHKVLAVDLDPQQPVAKSPLHSTGAASRLNCVVRRSNMANMLPPHALSAGRPARLGATRGFTTGCQANLSQAFMTRSYTQFLEQKKPSIVEIFQGYRPPSSGEGSPCPLDVAEVVVGDTPLGGPNLQLIPSRFDFSNHLIDSLKPDSRVLARLLSEYFCGQGSRHDRLRSH